MSVGKSSSVYYRCKEVKKCQSVSLPVSTIVVRRSRNVSKSSSVYCRSVRRSRNVSQSSSVYCRSVNWSRNVSR